MEALYITLIVLFGTLILICAILFILAFLIGSAAFGSRCDKNPLLTYFTAEDFGLSAKQIDISCVKNQYVRAVLYKKAGVTPKDEIIIFCHGMGPGHIAYTTEIAYFCNLGYTVLAPDYEGCNLSDGKSIKGFENGRITITKAIYYARENLTRSGKIYLVGHSWGAYSALCAAAGTGEVDKVVAISAPDRAEKAIYNAISARLSKIFAKILYPFISFLYADKSAAALTELCNCKILLIHGENDTVVPPDNAVYFKVNGAKISKCLAKNKRHNPYNTIEAENKLAELSTNLAKVKSGEVGEEYFKGFDFKAATEEDAAVMEEIARFLSENAI